MITMTNKKLTQQQEQFITYLLEGKTQLEAYKLAYPKAQGKDSTIRTKAYQLLHKPHIQARYNDLLEQQQMQLREQAVYNKEDVIKDLLWIKQVAENDIRQKGYNSKASNSVIKSVQELSKILGYYPNESKSVDVSMVTQTYNPYADLTLDQLIALAGDYEDDDQ